MAKRNIIYIPGLSDPYTLERLVLLLWHLLGAKVYYFPSRWSSSEDFEQKLARLTDKCDELLTQHKPLSLVGTSAGASLAINGLGKYRDKIKGVTLICGKINNPQTIGQRIYTKNPAFRESIDRSLEVISSLTKDERARILSIHPIRDLSVPVPDTIIDGAVEKQVPTYGHIPSIAIIITLYKWSIVRFLHRWR